MKSRLLTTAAIVAAASALACTLPVLADDFGRDRDHGHDQGRDNDHDRDHHRHPHDIHTETPIKHLVIIFNENRSFDHYFATYPNAANPSGSIPFVPKPHTPKVNNLANAHLLVNNPNNSAANGTGATDPFRLDRTQANTRSQNHSYTPEQQAVFAKLPEVWTALRGGWNQLSAADQNKVLTQWKPLIDSLNAATAAAPAKQELSPEDRAALASMNEQQAKTQAQLEQLRALQQRDVQQQLQMAQMERMQQMQAEQIRMMSNIAASAHDTNMTIIRNMAPTRHPWD